jgi:hypothetical protein
MNVSTTYANRRMLEIDKKKTQAGAGTAVTHDDSERRMRPTGMQAASLRHSFWDLTESLPRANQVNLAATYLVSQVMQNGVTQPQRDFLSSAQTKFSPDDMQMLQEQLRKHPLIAEQPAGIREGLRQQIETLLSGGAPQKVQEIRPQPQIQDVPARTPNELFFHTSFRPRPRGAVPGI